MGEKEESKKENGVGISADLDHRTMFSSLDKIAYNKKNSSLSLRSLLFLLLPLEKSFNSLWAAFFPCFFFPCYFFSATRERERKRERRREMRRAGMTDSCYARNERRGRDIKGNPHAQVRGLTSLTRKEKAMFH